MTKVHVGSGFSSAGQFDFIPLVVLAITIVVVGIFFPFLRFGGPFPFSLLFDGLWIV